MNDDDEWWHLVGTMPFWSQADSLLSGLGERKVKIHLEPDVPYAKTIRSYYPVFEEQEVEQEVDMTRIDDAREAGYNLAQSLCDIFTVRAGVPAHKILRLGNKVAIWEGYRGDFEAGSEFSSGFLSGFFDAQPKLLREKDE